MGAALWGSSVCMTMNQVYCVFFDWDNAILVLYGIYRTTDNIKKVRNKRCIL